MTAMTKTKFKDRWESGDDGGGITFDDIADCAKAWGLFHTPRIRPLPEVAGAVLVAAGVLPVPGTSDYGVEPDGP